MVAYLAPLRELLLAAALVFASGAALAAETTARTAQKHTDQVPDDTLDGLLILAGIVGVLVLLAWVSARIGDNRSHVVD